MEHLIHSLSYFLFIMVFGIYLYGFQVSRLGYI